MNKEERDRYITRAQSEPLTLLTELGSFLWGMLVGVGWLVAFVGGLLFILNLLGVPDVVVTDQGEMWLFSALRSVTVSRLTG